MDIRRPDYAAALLPDRFRACGVWLLPHTLGHALLMRRLGNPYAVTAKQPAPEIGHTIQAAYVCSRSWRAGVAGVNCVRSAVWIRVRSWLRWHSGTEDRLAMWGYLTAAWTSPTVWTKSRSSEFGSDPVQVLVTDQRGRWGKSLEAALDTPVAIALLERIEHLEHCGALRVCVGKDLALYEKLREIESRTAAPASNPLN